MDLYIGYRSCFNLGSYVKSKVGVMISKLSLKTGKGIHESPASLLLIVTTNDITGIKHCLTGCFRISNAFIC